MGLFQPSEGDVAVIVSNGIHKQVPLYTWNGYLYANVSGGFVRLNEDGSTSHAKTRLVHLDIVSLELHRDSMGRLCCPSTDRKTTPLDEPKRQLLIGSE